MQDEQLRFIERAGVLWEQDGMPRIAGRIYGLMLITDDALSLDQIADSLGVSKASVSNDTRLLERLGFIERVGRPSDRKDYYQHTERSFERAIEERIQRMHQLEALIDSARDMSLKSPAIRKRLENHHYAFSRITKALESALDGLKKRNSAK
jgi:DNA-binding transcriptional regulator GbsR (MarR family)